MDDCPAQFRFLTIKSLTRLTEETKSEQKQIPSEYTHSSVILDCDAIAITSSVKSSLPAITWAS